MLTYVEMSDSHTEADGSTTVLAPPFELELADGTRLVLEPEAKPARIARDVDHAITLADVQRAGGEPFAGYRLIRD